MKLVCCVPSSHDTVYCDTGQFTRCICQLRPLGKLGEPAENFETSIGCLRSNYNTYSSAFWLFSVAGGRKRQRFIQALGEGPR